MIGASLTTATHVPTLVRKLVGHHFCVEARAGDGNSRNSLSGSAFLNKRQILPATASVVSRPMPGNAIATFLPEWRDWRRTIERNPNIALVRRRFLPTRRDSSRGTNFSGGIIQALRSLLFRYPLVPVSPKTTRGSLKCLVFSPIPFVAAAHVEQHAAKEVQHVGIAVGEIGNV